MVNSVRRMKKKKLKNAQFLASVIRWMMVSICCIPQRHTDTEGGGLGLGEGGGNDEFILDNTDFKVSLRNTGTYISMEPDNIVKG